MNDSIKKSTDEYIKMNLDYLATKKSLESLIGLKSSINENRFATQKEEYEKKIEYLSPKLNDLKERLNEDLNKFEDEFRVVENEFNKLNKAIDEEKKMYKGKAISKEQYNMSINQLKDELKSIKPRYNDLKSQIKSIKNAFSNKKSFSINKPTFGIPGIPTVKNPKNPRSLNKDFWKGFIALIIVIISIPLLGFIVLSLKGVALFIVPVIALIIGIAFLGRTVSFVQQVWR